METPAPLPLLIAALEATGAQAILLGERGELCHVTPAARRALELSPDEQPAASTIARRAEERGLKRRIEPLPGGLKLELIDAQPRLREVLEIALHDLRSPIANVRSYAGLLTRGKLTTEKLARLADVIARNADRALRLTADYVESELAQLGALGVHREERRLLPLIEGAIASRRSLAQERGVTIALLQAPEVTLRLDAERMAHALETVLDRAVARSPDGARATVSVEVLPQAVHVDVVDAGGAPPPNELGPARDARIVGDRRLFPAVGLSVARSVLEAHGGSLQLLPAAQGARWRLALPRG